MTKIIDAFRNGKAFIPFITCGDPDLETTAKLVRAAAELIREPEAAVLLSCPRKDQRMLVFARGTEAPWDMARLLRDCGGHGGGRPDMARGAGIPECVSVARKILATEGIGR